MTNGGGRRNECDVKPLARFTLMTAALIALTGWLLSLGFVTGAERKALLISALLAGVVQMAAFGMLQWFGRDNALVGWGLGAILRGTVLVVYGLFFARMFGLPLTAALVGFSVFLFVCMLLESLLLAYDR